jgi:wobble nucleotide-excising tRNase
MIKKIISISNMGNFVNYTVKSRNCWDGCLTKINVIYAENGSGKTTLATILKSLSSNDSVLMDFKKTFSTSSSSIIKLLDQNNNIIEYNGQTWNSTMSIEVFDTNYVEDYLFVGSVSKQQNKQNLYKLLLGEDGKLLKTKLKKIINDRLKFEKENGKRNKTFLEHYDLEFNKIKEDFEKIALPIYKKHITKINKYLNIFCNYIRINKFTFQPGSTGYELYNTIPVFEIYDKEIEFSWPSLNNKFSNARYSLSEGDKSTIALCFFLARLDLNKIQKKIIVFDDPLSSFDHARRISTITQLASVAEKAEQLILMTHDIHFANDFTKKCKNIKTLGKVTNLRIKKIKGSAGIYCHNITQELFIDFQKEIFFVREFFAGNDYNEQQMRDVAKSIRTILEGIFKVKYFDIIDQNIWLGEIIELINKNRTRPRFNKLNKYRSKLVLLNDYSSKYHHSDSTNRNEPIVEHELRSNVELLLEIYDKI